MRKLAPAILAVLLICAMFFTACGERKQPYNNDTLSDEVIDLSPTPGLGEYTGPEVSAAVPNVDAAYTIKAETLYWPEGATEATADYMLSYELPVFSAPEGGYAAMNELLALYEAELLERVAAERIPFADRVEGEDVPATFVVCTVSYAAEYVNVAFNETAYFGSAENKEELVRTLVMDSAGNEVNFYHASGLYAPEEIAAQQIWNIIDRDSAAYHGDVTLEDISASLDLFNGFIVTDTGYTLFVAPGVLAPAENGVLSFSFTRAALYPSFVGEVMSIEQYEAMRPALSALSAACAAEYRGFAGGSPPAFVATDFMTRMNIASATYHNNFFATMPQAEYEAYFAGCFTGSFPQDIAAGDGTYLQDGAYYLPYALMAKYGVHLDGGSAEGGTVTLSGVLMYGNPGDMEFGEVAPVTIQLELDEGSPIGCRFISLGIR